MLEKPLLDGVAGLAVRMPTTFAVMGGSAFTFKEKLFFAFAWSPKVRPTLTALPMVPPAGCCTRQPLLDKPCVFKRSLLGLPSARVAIRELAPFAQAESVLRTP